MSLSNDFRTDTPLQTVESRARRDTRRSLLWLVPLYFVLVSVTDAHFSADTANYVDSVVERLGGANYHFWEFSHLFWRPLGLFWMHAGGAWLRRMFAGEAGAHAVATYAYTLTNLALGALSVWALRAWTGEFRIGARWANFVCVSFICAHAFLNFAQTGTSYAAGLSFLLLGFYFATRRRENLDSETASHTYVGDDENLEDEDAEIEIANITNDATKRPPYRRRSRRDAWSPVIAGVCLACAVCLWITFLWALPAAFLAPLVLFSGGARSSSAKKSHLDNWRASLRNPLLMVLTTALCGAVIYGAVLWFAVGARSPADALAWVRSSPSLGTTETKGASRMVFGLARSFIYMGNDGMIIKRYLIGDPFNPVTIFDLFRLSLWKLLLFYMFLAAIASGLWTRSDAQQSVTTSRRVLLLLAINAAPVLLFAINFDGGAIERYLPLYPTVFFAAAFLLGARSDKDDEAPDAVRGGKVFRRRVSLVSRWTALVFLVVAACVNLWAMSFVRLRAEQQRISGRAEELAARLKPQSRVFVVNWQDDLINFNRSFPFHKMNLSGGFRPDALITPGTILTRTWRADFARLALKTWDAGGDVWISRRAFAERPKADWNWVEGDDRRVRWRDVPTFFADLKTDEQAGGADGFVRLARTAENENTLRAKSVYPPE